MVTTDKVRAGESSTGTSTNTSTTASQWQTYNHYQAERGWECPRCGRINAPWVRSCDCSRNNWSITWTTDKFTTGDKPEWWKDYVTCNQADNVLNNPNYYTTSAHNETVGGSDYWNPTTKTWENVSSTQSNSTTYPPNCHTFNYSTPTKGD